MPVHHNSTAAQALFRVFVLPTLSTTPPRPLLLQTSSQLRQRAPPPTTQYHLRPFTTTPPRPTKSREPERRTQKWNEEITARIVQLVDPETNTLTDEPRTRFDILNGLDKKTHRLIQLSPDEPENRQFVPVCKIVSKKEQYEVDKKRKAQAKERAKEGAKASSVKTLELNWAIDSNDLAHRLERVQEFLSEGRRVEVVLAAKKRGRKATKAECEDVLKRVDDCLGSVPGATQLRPLEGKLGAFATLILQGRGAGEQKAQPPLPRSEKKDEERMATDGG